MLFLEARLTLARAVYSRAEILLLDDILAALDVHTARWIVDKCIRGDLVRGRTVLLAVSIPPHAPNATEMALDSQCRPCEYCGR